MKPAFAFKLSADSPAFVPSPSLELPDTRDRTERFSSSKLAHNQYLSLKPVREVERLYAIKHGLIPDPSKRMALSEAIEFTGTCLEMCPRFEREEREYQQNIERWELTPGTKRVDPARAVKAFHRPAAGNDQPLPSDVRPPEVLVKTLDYLLHDLLPSAPLEETHPFIRDRTRSIRQDFTLQNDRGVEAVRCHERIARYHILCLHALCEESSFAAQQEMEQLSKVLQSLNEFYDDLRESGVECPQEPEFRAYHILTHLRDVEATRSAQSLPDSILMSRPMQLALRFHAYAQRGNEATLRNRPHNTDASLNGFSLFFKLVDHPDTSYLTACMLEHHFSNVRRGALKALKRAYLEQHSALPIDHLTRILGCDDALETANVAEHAGIIVNYDPEDESRPISVALHRKSDFIDSGPLMSQRKSMRLVERKRVGQTYGQIIDASPAAEASSLLPHKSIPKSNGAHEPCVIKSSQPPPTINHTQSSIIHAHEPPPAKFMSSRAEPPIFTESDHSDAEPSLSHPKSAPALAPVNSQQSDNHISKRMRPTSISLSDPKPTIAEASSNGQAIPTSASRPSWTPKLISARSISPKFSFQPVPSPRSSIAQPSPKTAKAPVSAIYEPAPRAGRSLQIFEALVEKITEQVIADCVDKIAKQVAERQLEAFRAAKAQRRQDVLDQETDRVLSIMVEHVCYKESMLALSTEFRRRRMMKRYTKLWALRLKILRTERAREHERRMKFSEALRILGSTNLCEPVFEQISSSINDEEEPEDFVEYPSEDEYSDDNALLSKLTEAAILQKALWQTGTFFQESVRQLRARLLGTRGRLPHLDLVLALCGEKSSHWLESKFSPLNESLPIVTGVDMTVRHIAQGSSNYTAIMLFELNPICESAPSSHFIWASESRRLRRALDSIGTKNLYDTALLIVTWSSNHDDITNQMIAKLDVDMTSGTIVMQINSLEVDNLFARSLEALIPCIHKKPSLEITLNTVVDDAVESWQEYLILISSFAISSSWTVWTTLASHAIAALNEGFLRRLSAIGINSHNVALLPLPNFAISDVNCCKQALYAVLDYLNSSKFDDVYLIFLLRAELQRAVDHQTEYSANDLLIQICEALCKAIVDHLSHETRTIISLQPSDGGIEDYRVYLKIEYERLELSFQSSGLQRAKRDVPDDEMPTPQAITPLARKLENKVAPISKKEASSVLSKLLNLLAS